MTERQWLRTTCRLDNLIEHLQEHCSPSLRKQELLCVVYCRRIWRLITDERSRTGVEEVEALADNTHRRLGALNLRLPGDAAFEASRGNGTNWHAATAVECLVDESYHDNEPYEIDMIADHVLAAIWADMVGDPNLPDREFRAVCDPGAGKRTPAILAREMAVQGHLLRDVFGNPFRPVSADPSWLTSTVVDLAQGIYQERAFDRMPILADALMDAGCNNEEVLHHCRSEDPHVRGCWLIDSLLGMT